MGKRIGGRDVSELVSRSAAERPPLAVRTIASGSPARAHWKSAECSLSTGIRAPPPRSRAASARSPAATRLSLLASASVTPRSSAHIVAGQAGEAERRVQDDVRLRALQELGRVAADLRQRSEPVDRRRAGCGGDELERRVPGDHLDRLASDRPGGTEERDPRHGHSVPRHTRRVRMLLLTLALAAAVVALPAAADRVEGVPSFGPVFVLIGENTDYQHLDATDSRYMMNNLRPRSAWFTNYYAATHWSQANYVALTSGQFTDCEQADRGYASRRRRQRVPSARGRAGRGASGSKPALPSATPARAARAGAMTLPADGLLHDRQSADQLHEHLVRGLPRQRCAGR